MGNRRARRGQATTLVLKMERSQKKGEAIGRPPKTRSRTAPASAGPRGVLPIFTNQNQGTFLTRRGGTESLPSHNMANNGPLTPCQKPLSNVRGCERGIAPLKRQRYARRAAREWARHRARKEHGCATMDVMTYTRGGGLPCRAIRAVESLPSSRRTHWNAGLRVFGTSKKKLAHGCFRTTLATRALW